MWGAVDTLYDLIYFVLRNLKDFRWEALIGYSLYLLGKRSGMKMFRKFLVTHFKYLEDEDSQWRYYVNKQLVKLGAPPFIPKKQYVGNGKRLKKRAAKNLITSSTLSQGQTPRKGGTR